MKRIHNLACAALLLVLSVARADAHPHVWVTLHSEILYAADGSITGVRHAWRVDGLELRSVDGDARLRQQTHLSAKIDETGAHLLDPAAIVSAEIGDRLVVGREPPEQPDHFQIAACFPFQAAARLNAIEITVDVELEQRRRVIARSPSRRRLDVLKTHPTEVESLDERIDDANRIALIDPVEPMSSALHLKADPTRTSLEVRNGPKGDLATLFWYKAGANPKKSYGQSK
jgi:hypothetical protein